MDKSSLSTHKTTKTPKYITVTGMTPTQYYHLKLYIKSILLPGTPALNKQCFETQQSLEVYQQWLNNALEVIGPRFFPVGGSGYIWPTDHERIYKAVHFVVRDLSWKIRKSNQMKMGAGLGADLQNAEDGENHGAGAADAIVVAGVILVDEEMQTQGKHEDLGIVLQEQGREATDEEMDASFLELQDLLVLMIPEVATALPDLVDEEIDWDELLEFNSEA
ncbi:hypothetical protein L873DRAFT_1842982 [Choiromyces venosus 120613-1]|uniref:Uncharacterized protein n=1 Tax=Choiromyces venosus 120613-1 TaxID=1336337 RepID=A0A3N4JQY1_9PEZI|nr:hypothetical protein L873DRAFT_1842982 [Choiromyces venosus 120613-1]